MPHYADFRLSITDALETQLIAAFRGLSPVALNARTVAAAPIKPGVYRLHYPTPDVAYVGKADRDLRSRLTNHFRKLGGRDNIVLANVGFTYITLEEDLTAIAPETILIRWHKKQAASAAKAASAAARTAGTTAPTAPSTAFVWNGSGFGNKDPGRNRDTQEPSEFDRDHPIILTLQPPIRGSQTVQELLARFRGGPGVAPALPYPLRAEKNASTEFAAATVSVAPGDSVSTILRAIVDALNANLPGTATLEWQATALPGTLILYRERPRGGPHKAYPHSIQQW